MPKKRICIILESEEELLDMIRKEKKGRFRDRLRLLWLPETGKAKSTAHAAELFGITYHTAAEWLRRYENGGIPELLCLKTVPGRQRAISGEVLGELKKRLSDRKDSDPTMRYGHGLWMNMILIFLIKLSIRLSDITSEPN